MELFLKFPVVTILLPIFFQKPGLSQKERLYLKKAIPMLVYCTERQMSGPRFKSIAIQTETQITGKGNKEYIFPMIVATLQTCGNGLCLLFKTLYLQSR